MLHFKLTKFPNCFMYSNDELLCIVIREIQIGSEFVFPNYNLFFQLWHNIVFFVHIDWIIIQRLCMIRDNNLNVQIVCVQPNNVAIFYVIK
jgi:hypothetical protein